MTYDCIIIGGGIAGLQAAIQLGRYMHEVLVIDADDGRSVICKSYHNILGYPDGISGQALRKIGRQQAESFGVKFIRDRVVRAEKEEQEFLLHTELGAVYKGKRLLLATGVMDRIPEIPNLRQCLGVSIYVCPDCDGYEVKDKPTIVIGSGNTGASKALTIHYWTKRIIYINHEKEIPDEHLMLKMEKLGIQYVQSEIQTVLAEGDRFFGVRLKSGEELKAERAFIAFGGTEVRSEIASQLGAERLENRHLYVDARTKMTNVEHLWAIGDVTAHSEQVTIAMGDGAQASIWIHKTLLSEK